MEGGFGTSPFLSEQEEPSPTWENGMGSPFHGGKASTTSSPKRRRGTVKKRVVSVPIGGDGEGSRAKGDGAPPSDSWAWRKYGQKPIKGSPYPRGYYRCSSYKGCPARKQVERSRLDPTVLLITYACDHNHPWPTSKTPTSKPPTQDPDLISDAAHDNFPDATLLADDFCWFSDVASSPTPDTLLESPICAGSDGDVASIGEEEESLFADLGELPEGSVAFRKGFYGRRRCGLKDAPCCGSTG